MFCFAVVETDDRIQTLANLESVSVISPSFLTALVLSSSAPMAVPQCPTSRPWLGGVAAWHPPSPPLPFGTVSMVTVAAPQAALPCGAAGAGKGNQKARRP